MIGAISYAAFLTFASIVSFEDWKERKIKNERILQGLALCAFGAGFLILNSTLGQLRLRAWGLGELYYPWAYYWKIALHLALSLAASLLFWRLHIWPAGDAKFFVVAAFFLVLIEPNLPGFPALLFLVLLINIFVPAGLAFAAGALAELAASLPAAFGGGLARRLKAAADAVRVRVRDAWPHRGRYATLAANVLVLFIVVHLAQERLMRLPLGPFGQLAIFFAMILAWPKMGEAVRKWAVSLWVLLANAAVLLAAGLLLGWPLWAAVVSGVRMFFNFGMFLSVAWFGFNQYLERQSRREAEAASLGAGDILAEESFQQLKEHEALKGKLGKRYCDGLTEDEARALRALPASVSATVYSAIPFAVWIFMGALITLSCKTTIVPVLVDAVRAGVAHAR